MRRRLALLLVAWLAASATLGWLAQGIVRAFLLAPLWSLFLTLRLLWESLPGLWLWGTCVLSALALALHSLLVRSGRAPAEAEPQTPPVGPLHRWARDVERAAAGEYFRWRLAQRTGGLAAEMLAHQHRLPREEVVRRLAEGDLGVPGPVRAFLTAGLTSRPFRDQGNGRAGPPDLEPAVAFLESLLEVGGDRTG